MSKILSKLWGFFNSRRLVGVDRAGNRYFTRKEEIDGAMKEKRWVVFKGEEDPTSIPVEWICWLNGQRKKAPTPEGIPGVPAIPDGYHPATWMLEISTQALVLTLLPYTEIQINSGEY